MLKVEETPKYDSNDCVECTPEFAEDYTIIRPENLASIHIGRMIVRLCPVHRRQLVAKLIEFGAYHQDTGSFSR